MTNSESMKNMLDKIISPYADDQPNIRKIDDDNKLIERIPLLCDATGQIIPQFQTFYNKVVAAVYSCDWVALYELSDKSLDLDSFIQLIEKQWLTLIYNWSNKPDEQRNFDIELNMQRFQETHFRNIIGGFNIMFYYINITDDQFSEDDNQTTSLVECSTELLFTYKNDEFKIISVFKPILFHNLLN